MTSCVCEWLHVPCLGVRKIRDFYTWWKASCNKCCDLQCITLNQNGKKIKFMSLCYKNDFRLGFADT